MKRILGLCIALMACVTMSAQSAYISYSPYSQADRIGDLNGAGGVLILSKRNDLVITVVNAPSARVSAASMRTDGYYEYEVVIDRKQTTEPKIEVNRRGDIDRLDWVAITKADYFRAFMIEETQKPIRMENQTAKNDAILDANLAQVEFQTTIPDLTVECKELVSRGATVTTEKKKGDNSIIITQVTIPIKILNDARQRVEEAEQAHDALRKQLVDTPNGNQNASDKEWERLDQLEEAAQQAREELMKLTYIKVYATGTNQLPVDISGLKARSKMVYGVLLRTIIEEKHVSKCAGFMSEGGRQFALREYANARQAFTNALNAPDTPADMKTSIRTSIAQCDTCTAYEQWTLAAFARMREIKNTGGSQEDAVACATAAIDYLQLLNRYNPSDFYSERIKQLEAAIKSLPLELRLTTVRWVKNVSGFFEGGKISGVEVWLFKGTTPPAPKEYRTEKKFRDMASRSADFVQFGTTDSEGVADLRLNRDDLPKGIFLRPIGHNDKIKVFYINFNDLISQSQGTYNKRQFRVKMYAEN
ncbi:MAG: hypothetical protein IJ614_01270 [Prevotella sp.]|nr:hypothetical protein [Prevotella sp.]